LLLDLAKWPYPAWEINNLGSLIKCI